MIGVKRDNHQYAETNMPNISTDAVFQAKVTEKARQMAIFAGFRWESDGRNECWCLT